MIINMADVASGSRLPKGRVALTGERATLTARGVQPSAMTAILTHGSAFRGRWTEGGKAGMDDRRAGANDVVLCGPFRLFAAERAMQEALESTGGHAFDMLIILINRTGNVATREELFQCVFANVIGLLQEHSCD